MYPASKWRITLRALDDDPRVAVLINRSVSRDTLSTLGFPSRRWTVVSSPSLLSRPWWNLPQNLVVVAVEKWKALCAFQAQRLSTALSGCDHLHWMMPIVFAAGVAEKCRSQDLLTLTSRAEMSGSFKSWYAYDLPPFAVTTLQQTTASLTGAPVRRTSNSRSGTITCAIPQSRQTEIFGKTQTIGFSSPSSPGK